jgi:hypothetical protein
MLLADATPVLIAIPILVVLAVIAVAAALRRRDTGLATGALSRETRTRDAGGSLATGLLAAVAGAALAARI